MSLAACTHERDRLAASPRRMAGVVLYFPIITIMATIQRLDAGLALRAALDAQPA